jgi:HSP20 family protein
MEELTMANTLQTRTRTSTPARSDPVISLFRLFDDVFRGAGLPTARGDAQTGTIIMPNIDISETDSELKIRAELPGVSEQDVEVILNDDILTIRAEREFEREEDKEDYHLVEMSYGTFQRSLQLPYRVDPNQVQAWFENGILNITVPKAKAQQRSNRIQLQGSGESRQGAKDQDKPPHNGKGEKGQEKSQEQPRS